MLQIVIATRNLHKFKELKSLIATPGICFLSLKEFPNVKKVRETGRTFKANAVKKAREAARATGHIAVADDSGLAVDALHGAPGIYSARFAGLRCDDKANNAKLLKSMNGLTARRRRGRYHCVLALVSPKKLIATTRGSWEGYIATSPSGNNGFGYDPIFVVPMYRKTVGQLPMRIKQKMSHRAVAARRLRPILAKLAR